MSHLLALDQGTTSSRAILFARDTSIVGVAQQEFRQIFPQPGWVEHDANEIWVTQSAVIDEVLAKSGVRASDIAGVGITNQRETTVVWDAATGEPIHNAIVWQDRRTAEVCEELRAAGHEETIRAKTGLLLDAYFSGTKVAWILDHVPGARDRAERGELRFGTIDCWLAWKLAGVHVTDPSNASRTLLYDIHEGAWDDELLGILRVPKSLLPEVGSSSAPVGELRTPESLAGCTLAGIVGDQQAATMGQVCTEPGLAKNTYGTGCFLLLNTGERALESHNRLLSTVAWGRDGALTYALEGSVFVGGAIVQWLRDELKMFQKAGEVEALAASVDDNGGVYFVPALTGLGAPHWDPYARGAILGITRGTTTAHIARAALEGITFQVADLVRAMEADAGTPLAELRVDGGAAANDLLLQFQADLLQVPVVRPTVLETTALGAAYMAGLSSGVYESVEEIRSFWKIDRRFEPQMAASEAEALRSRWQDAVERARGWARSTD